VLILSAFSAQVIGTKKRSVVEPRTLKDYHILYTNTNRRRSKERASTLVYEKKSSGSYEHS